MLENPYALQQYAVYETILQSLSQSVSILLCRYSCPKALPHGNATSYYVVTIGSLQSAMVIWLYISKK